ncbi:MAG TPA: hypothetical protein VKR32_20035 [Puia sp.]|nr:hypothetical protein [Puia sp.]
MKYVNYKANRQRGSEMLKRTELYDTNINSIKNVFMDKQDSIDERLWDYIDGLCSNEEKSAIEQLIESNIEWQKKYRDLLQLNELLTSAELEAPSMRFTRNVIEEIAKHQVAPAARQYIDKKIIWGIGTFFLTLIAGFLIYALAQIHFAAGGNSPAEDLITKYNPGNLSWGKYFNNTYVNIFLLINVVLGLVMLDMIITRKKKLARQQGA